MASESVELQKACLCFPRALCTQSIVNMQGRAISHEPPESWVRGELGWGEEEGGGGRRRAGERGKDKEMEKAETQSVFLSL